MAPPFTLFGTPHIAALSLSFAAPGLAAALIRPRAYPRADQAFRWAMGAAISLNWIGWMLLLDSKGWLGIGNEFPLNLCDWATIATVITLFRPNQRTYELAYFWALAGTLQGMLTPDLERDFPDMQFVLFFIFHGGIIASVLYLTIGGKLRPYPSSIPRAIGWTFFYAGVAGLFDWLSGANYGMLREKPPYPTILDVMPAWPWYIGVLILMGLASTVFYYAPFFVLDQVRAFRKRSDTVAP